MIKKYNNIVLSLSINLKHKRSAFDMRLTNTKVIEKMHQLNLVRFFERTPKGVTVHVNTKFSKIVSIHQYNRTHSKIYFSKNQILKKKLNIGATVYLFSTPKGVLTQYEAIRQNQGGFLLSKITLA